MNLSPSSDTPFGDRSGFMAFLGDNEIAHISFSSALAKRGIVVSNVLPVGNPYDLKEWLGDHWQRHIEECKTLGIPVPDLSTVDLNDEKQYLDWMDLHAQVHRLQNAILGITT